MLSDRLYGFINFYCKIAAYLGIIFVDWCPITQQTTYSARALRRLRFNTLLLFLWLLFTIGQLIRFHVSSNFEDFNTTLMYGIGTTLTFETFSIMAFNPKDGMDLMNAVLFYLKYMNKEYLPKYNPNNSKLSYFLEAGMILLCCTAIVVIPLNWFFAFVFPKSPNFVGSILPDNGCPLFIVIVIRYIFPCYCLLFMYVNVFTYAGIFFLYGVLIVPFVILEFRVGRSASKYFACHQLRQPPTLYKAFRIVQVVQLKINTLLGPFLVPTQALFGKFVVFMTYMLMKHGHHMLGTTKLMLYIWCSFITTFWCLILLMGGYMNLYGRKILNSWKYHDWKELSKREKKILQKFRKSCSPLCIAHGKTFTIRRLSVLKFMRGLVVGIFRVLLTIGKD